MFGTEEVLKIYSLNEQMTKNITSWVIYSRLLKNTGSSCEIPLIWWFFFFISYTLGLLYLWVSNPQIQPTIDQKQYFRFLIRNPQTQRANCMHCSVQFYMRDFSVRRFWYCRNPGTTTLWIMEYCSQVLGESKVIPEFSLHGVGASNPTLLKG